MTKSDLILEYENGPASDFRYIHEELYLTPSGKYLLKGEGGPISEYSTYTWPDTWGYGSRKRTLSEAQAKAWAIDRGVSPLRYENAFGKPYPEKEKDD